MDSDKLIQRRMRGITPELQQAAWNLRRQMTPAEQTLWEELRERRLSGLRFRRQHPVGQFVLDFYCSQHKLVVELDGAVHEGRAEEDAARTAYLAIQGYRVIRFSNEAIAADLPAVLERIAAACSEPERDNP